MLNSDLLKAAETKLVDSANHEPHEAHSAQTKSAAPWAPWWDAILSAAKAPFRRIQPAQEAYMASVLNRPQFVLPPVNPADVARANQLWRINQLRNELPFKDPAALHLQYMNRPKFVPPSRPTKDIDEAKRQWLSQQVPLSHFQRLEAAAREARTRARIRLAGWPMIAGGGGYALLGGGDEPAASTPAPAASTPAPTVAKPPGPSEELKELARRKLREINHPEDAFSKFLPGEAATARGSGAAGVGKGPGAKEVPAGIGKGPGAGEIPAGIGRGPGEWNRQSYPWLGSALETGILGLGGAAIGAPLGAAFGGGAGRGFIRGGATGIGAGLGATAAQLLAQKFGVTPGLHTMLPGMALGGLAGYGLSGALMGRPRKRRREEED